MRASIGPVAGAVLVIAATAWAAVSPLSAAAQAPADSTLRVRVQAALDSSSDVPSDSISVAVADGVVVLTGSVVCDPCGGTSTPGGSGTVQQSLGAVVRAVPGVRRVEFRLRYNPD